MAHINYLYKANQMEIYLNGKKIDHRVIYENERGCGKVIRLMRVYHKKENIAWASASTEKKAYLKMMAQLKAKYEVVVK